MVARAKPPVTPPLQPAEILPLMKDSTTFGPDEVRRLLGSATGASASEFRRAVDTVAAEAQNPTMKVRAGIGFFLLGQPQKAIEALTGCKDGMGRFYLASALSTLSDHADAAKEFDEAGKLGYHGIECKLRQAGELRMAGKLDDAEKIVRATGAEGARLAEYSYQMGAIMSDRGDTFGAIEYFERSVDMDPHHTRALFALAVQCSRHGSDDDAIRLYERCLSRPPFYLGALLNLGLLYEDKENYSCAQYCFERVLRFDPNNQRARLYLKDIEATSSMYYDEDTLKQQQKLEQLLNKPVTDFELSVRSRNCLAGINIQSLGDLTRISEQDLLLSKNFGETSLNEVKELMVQHNLVIGQNLAHKPRDTAVEFRELSPEEQVVCTLSVADLNLSVRSRKCMTRLGITSVGELIQRTPDELLSAKNFGVTSLNEIRAKLGEHALKLRND